MVRKRGTTLSKKRGSVVYLEEQVIIGRLFQAFDTSGNGEVCVDDIINVLLDSGIRLDDPRLEKTLEIIDKGIQKRNSGPTSPKNLKHITKAQGFTSGITSPLDVIEFREIVSSNLTLFEKIINGDLIVPDWPDFTKDLEEIFHETRDYTSGKTASSIPQLQEVDPEKFAMSICTIDGQRFSIGDAYEKFCVHSCCKPINYAMALEEQGLDTVLKYIGFEPNGQEFNTLSLNSKNLPHNPCVNAGGIMSCSLYKREYPQADRFEHCLEMWKSLCGDAEIGFDNPTYLSEKNTADSSFCLGYMMRECDAFPPHTNLMETLELYFMTTSMTVTADDFAVLAASLANGGVVPTTQNKVLESDTVQSLMSIMYSCGLYDYSGEWTFRIGIPAKSARSGCIMGVVPEFGGFVVWSPRLDQHKNSVRGIEFFKKLVQKFNFHHFDSIISRKSLRDSFSEEKNELDKAPKKDPRKKKNIDYRREVVNLLFAASEGNLREIRRLSAMGLDLNSKDYDGRTALHLAASENQRVIVQYLLKIPVDPAPVDRWGSTPLDDARRGGHESVESVLLEAMKE